jgi:hypothetical protein
MKKNYFLKTIGFILIIGFVSIATNGFSQSSNYLDFDGGNDYVRYSDDATLGRMDGATDYTIEAWIYPIDGVVAEYDRVMQRYYSFNIVMYDGDDNGQVEDWYFTLMDGSNHYFNTQGDATLTLDAWNHIAVINNSTDGTLKLFVNGVDVTATGGYSNLNLRPSQNGDNLYIGSSRGSTPNNSFGGYIDEVRLKNVAESIANLQTKITDTEYSSDANTAGLFHFDEGSGSSTVNEASSSNATLYNGTTWRSWDYQSGHSLPLDNRYVWNGGTDTDYATTTNWDPGVAPTSADNVIVPDVTNDPLIGASTSVSCVNMDIMTNGVLSIRGDLTVSGTLTNGAGTTGLVIKADGSGNGSLIESNGVSATVEQHLSADAWHLVSLPIASAQASVYTDIYLYEWIEADSAFTEITSTSYGLSATHGYYAYSSSSISSPTDVEFTGNLNTGDKAISWMTYNAQGYTGQDGWNLAGNPYPSGLTWDNTWSQTNLTSTVYVFDAGTTGNWITYNYTTTLGDLTNGEIPPTQGFFVKASAASPSMTIPDAARVHTSNTFYKGSEINEGVFNINISSNENTYTDNLYLGINDEATDNFDSQFDTYKLMGLENAPQLYSFDIDSKLAVNLFPEFVGSKIIPLGLRVGIPAEYTINAENLENFDAGVEVYLQDNASGEMIDLRENPVYTFYAEQGLDESRFVLHFNPEFTDIDLNSSSNDINIYAYAKTVVVNYQLQNPGDIIVYDISGRIMANGFAQQGLNETKLQVESGYYFVKVISSSTIKTQKVFLR